MLQILLILFLPLAIVYLSKRYAAPEWLSPVVLCYALGMLMANSPMLLDFQISQDASSAAVLLGVPLLLLSSDIKLWKKQAKVVMLSFALCVLSGMFCSFLAGHYFGHQMQDSGKIAGMLVGLYTGGTPNMAMISKGLNVPNDVFVVLNTADILGGGIYLLFLTSIAKKWLSRFLPAYKSTGQQSTTAEQQDPFDFWNIGFKNAGYALGVALSVIGLAVGLTFLIYGNLGESSTAVLIVSLTSFSTVASLFKRIRHLKGSYTMGMYGMLCFCVAAGMSANFSEVIGKTPVLVLCTFAVLIGTISLHYVLAAFFKIDVDTAIITSTAAIFGPPFIGQVAGAINNKEVVLSGMTTGVLGLAIGNYVGILVAYLVGV